MAKEQRLIDANAVLLAIDIHGTNKFGMLDEDIREFIKKQPTVDAVPVVRCRDCKAYEKDCGYCEAMGFTCEQDDFCSKGERRTDNG